MGKKKKKNLLNYIWRSTLFHCSLHMLNIFRGHGNYAFSRWYVLFFSYTSPGSQVVSSHLHTMPTFHFFVLFFFLYKSHNFFCFQWCKKPRQIATVLWTVCDWKSAVIRNTGYQNSDISSRLGTKLKIPWKGHLRIPTRRIGEQRERKGCGLCKQISISHVILWAII